MLNIKLLGIIGLSATIIFTGCTDDKNTANPLDGRQSFPVLTGETLPLSDSLLNPHTLFVIGDGLLIEDPEDSHFYKYFKDINNSSMTLVATKGMGPDEFIKPRNVRYDGVSDRIFIYDTSLKKGAYLSPIDGSVVESCILSDAAAREILTVGKCFIGNGAFKNGYFAAMDSTGKTKEVFGQIPLRKYEGEDHLLDYLCNQTQIAVSPDNTRFAAAGSFSDWLVFYDISGDRPSKIREYSTYPSALEVKSKPNGSYSVDFRPEAIISYRVLAPTDKYLYAMYDGRTNEEADNKKEPDIAILQFDWDGNFIKGVSIPERVFYIAVDNDDSTLYALVRTDEAKVLKAYSM